MKLLQLSPVIHAYDDFAAFHADFHLTRHDLILTNARYGAYLQGVDCPVIHREKFGTSEPTDAMVNAILQERDRIQDEQWQKEYDEMVRQYNENLAFQREQAAKSSSGGSRSSGGGGGVSNYDLTASVLANGGYSSAEMLQIIKDPSNGLSKNEQSQLIADYQKPLQKQEVEAASAKRNYNDNSAYWSSR